MIERLSVATVAERADRADITRAYEQVLGVRPEPDG
jgi:hypothetical protein